MIWTSGLVPYVPGKTARPAPDAFAHLTEGLSADDSPDALSKSTAFREARAAFDAGFYWEAHELFEAVWMCLPPASAEKVLVRGLIQLANAGLKRRMGRPEAARRIMELAESALSDAFQRTEVPMGLSRDDVDQLAASASRSVHYSAIFGCRDDGDC